MVPMVDTGFSFSILVLMLAMRRIIMFDQTVDQEVSLKRGDVIQLVS